MYLFGYVSCRGIKLSHPVGNMEFISPALRERKEKCKSFYFLLFITFFLMYCLVIL
jgi:hypothetical protein